MVDKIKETGRNTKEFIKRIIVVIGAVVAMLPVASGIYTVIEARTKHSFLTYLVIFSGAMSIMFGLFILYKVVMRGEHE